MKKIFSILLILFSSLYADLIQPSNLDSLYSIHGLFEWEQEVNAVSYNLQVANQSSFNDF